MIVALLGNQNSGKTTLFNTLTGTNQKVGNWPGVTIERKEGKIKGTDITIVDLPGIYSLSPYTQEEVVSRDFVLNEKVDLIINIVDATNIERSLYLTTQLLELDIDLVIALNMSDTLEKKNIKVDEKKLEELICSSVVKISALKNEGIDELISLINNKEYLKNENNKIYTEDVEKLLDKVDVNLNHKRFIKVKTIEKEEVYYEYLNQYISKEISSLEIKYGQEIEEIIANQRYNYIVDIKKECVKVEKQKETITDKLDKVFLNKYLAIPIFIVIMFAIYYLSVGVVGSFTVDLVDGAITSFSEWLKGLLESWNASNWAVSLICDGMIAGVGAVLNFVPQLMILFLCIAILETTGYMSRIAFFLDRLFRKFGLSGKSLIPFIVGSGCSVPGIMASRTVEDENEKRITIMCTPFIPCAAKLPIIALFAGAFFDKYQGLVTVSLYFLAIVLILLSSLVLKRFIKGSPSSFISELPEYKLPSIKYVLRDVLEKTVAFFKRARTVILICSVVVWVLLSFSWRMEYITKEYSHTLDNVNLETLANGIGIDFSKKQIESGNVSAILTFEDDVLKVSFKEVSGDSIKYSKKIDVLPKTTVNSLVNELGKNKDSRKTLVVDVIDGKINYGYSLTVENSILASIGKVFSFIFYPVIGEANWGATVSAFQGLVAKEQVVSSMAIISGLDEGVDNANLIFGSNSFKHFSPLSAYSFMIFNLFSAPCIGAIGAMRKELGSTKKMLVAVGFQTGLAWILASLVFGIGSLIGLML